MTVRKKSFASVGAILLLALLAMLVLSSCFGTQVIISFNSNGGKACDPITVTSDMESITLPTTLKNGYDFTGWYESRTATTPLPSVLTGDAIPKDSVTYYAGWKKKTVTVTFTVEETVLERRTVDMDALIEETSYPSLASYPSYEWRTESFRAVKDTTVAAVRKESDEQPDYLLTYMIPGGDGFVVYRTFKGKAGTSVGAPADPSPSTQGENVYFSGWFSDTTYTTAVDRLPTTIGETNVTLYARFTEITDDSRYLFYEDRTDGGVNVIGLNDVGIYQQSISIPNEIDGKPVLSIGKDTTGLGGRELGTFDSTFLKRVILPTTLREVGDWAFSGCSALEEVVFTGSSVTRIGKGAFAGCSGLKSLSLPENVTGIGAFAFAGIRAGKAVGNPVALSGLPLGLWERTEMSFSSLDLEEGSKLSSIGDYAFYGCPEMKDVTLSAVMRDFNHLAFAESGIESVSFAEGGNLVGVDGVVYSRSRAVLYYYPPFREGAYVMDENTTTIAPYAFYRNEKITGVTAGEGLKTVGEYAFYGCANLTTVDVSRTAVRTVGKSAFENCVRLRALEFPGGVETFGEDACRNCSDLTTASFAGETLTVIGDGAFYACEKLGAFYVPASVKTIGNDAFYGCEGLTSLTFSGRGVLEEIGDYAFYECTSIGEVLFPSGVKRIGKYAFASEKGKMSLYFDNDIDLTAVTYYGEGAFMNTQIDSVTISANIATNADIGKYLFKNCTSLKQAYFSATGANGYNVVPEGLFYGCTSLGRIIFSNNITVIDEYAFCNCVELETAQFGSSVTEIREGAFYGCLKLTNPGAARRILPVGLTYLGEKAFYGCASLASVNIPSGISKIEKETFARCSSLAVINYDDGTTLQTIDENAFAYCTSLVTAMLPATLAVRDENDSRGLVKNPFYGCSRLTRYELTGANEELTAEDGVIYRRLEKETAPGEYATQKAIYAYPTAKSSSTIRIAPSVAYIDRYAFFGCTVKGVDFERNDVSGVTETVVLVYVDDYAFAETQIETATVSMRVYHVGEGAFKNSALSTLTIDAVFVDGNDFAFDIVNTDTTRDTNVLTIGAYAFAETPIRSAVIPSRVAALGEGALSKDYSLASVTLTGGSITPLTVGDGAFAYDNLLREITFPASVTEIGSQALYYCNNVKTLSFASGSTLGLTLGNEALAEMHYLYEVRLPANVVSVGDGLFHGDTRLKYIRFPEELTVGTALELPDGIFSGLSALEELTIPAYVSRLGDEAFVRSSLRKITFLGTESDVDLSIGAGAFYALKTLEEIELSGNVVAIGDYAFAYSSLKNFTYGEGKDLAIGKHAFTETFLPGFIATQRVKRIGEGCFAAMPDMTYFRTEGGVTEIPDAAFNNCEKLHDVVLSDVVKTGKSSFAGTAVTAVLSSTLGEVGENAFYGSSIERISTSVSGGFTAEDRAFAGAKKLASVSVTATGAVTLGTKLFEGDTLLTAFSVTGTTITAAPGFGGGATALGEGFLFTETDGENANYRFDAQERVLYDADGTTFVYYPAAKVGSTFVLDATVDAIGDYAFYQNAGLTGLVIEGRDVTPGEACFDGVNAQLRIYVAEDKVAEYTNDWKLNNIYPNRAVAGGLVLTLQSSGEYSVTGYLGEAESVTLTGSVTDGGREYVVTSVGENAFRNNTVVKNVVIGSGIKTIAGGAFRNCRNLESVAIGENVTSIKSYAFYGCTALSTVRFAEGGSLLGVGNYAFTGDVSLREVALPAGVETVGIFAFADCTELFDVTMGEGLQEIGSNAFSGCVELPYIELPASLSRMGSYVFSGCEKIIYVELKGRTVCRIENNTFAGTPASIYYFVPDETAAKEYKVDGVWRMHISKILPATERCNVSGFEDYVLSANGDGYTLVAYLGTDEEVTVLSDVTKSVKVTSVGEYALGQFARKVVLSEGIVELKERAFYNAMALEEITLPSTLTTIGTYAFGFLDKLEKVTVTDEETMESRLETIGDYAFYGCYGLTAFEVPDSVTTVGARAFSCPDGKAMRFTAITFGEQEDVFLARNGKYVPLEENGQIRYNADGKYDELDVMQSGLIGRTLSRTLWTTDREGRNTLVYNAGTYVDRERGENILRLSQTTDNGIRVYTVEENALTVGSYAFANNTILREVKFGTYRRVTAMGEGAFAGCVALENLTIGYSPRVIGEDVVVTLTGDGSKVFADCLKLTVFLPSSAIMSRYNETWTVASNRQKLALSSYVNEDGFVFSVISNNNRTVTVINYLGDETEVVFPQSVQVNGEIYNVERIGREKVSGTGIKGYVIGGNVTRVTLPTGVKTIGEDAFRNSTSLTRAELPATILTIEQYAFAGCKNLTDINIPISVTTIEQYAFYDCDALNEGLEMQQATLPPASPTLIIGAYSFADCDALESFFVPNHVKSIGVATSSSSSVAAGHTFDGCAKLSSFTFSDTAKITAIGPYVFTGTAIEEIRLPASVETVADYVFARCVGLQRVYLERTITNTVTNVTSTGGIRIFDGVSNVHLKVYVPDATAYDLYNVSSLGWSQKTVIVNNVTPDGKFAYTANETNKTLTITDYRGKDDVVTIPRKVTMQTGTDYEITTLGKYFANAFITKVVFASDSLVTTIEDRAFSGCTNLTEIHLPDRLVNLGNASSSGGYVFENCTSLTDIVLPNGVTEIKASVFENCTALTEITLPQSINYISSSAFASCANLARVKVEFGSRLTSSTVGQSLDSSAFNGAGTAAGGMTVIVADEYLSLFSGWTSVSTKIYAESEVVGDFVVKLNDRGTALILVQYLGDETELNLRTLRLKGLPIAVINPNAVRNAETRFKADGSVSYPSEYEGRIYIEE